MEKEKIMKKKYQRPEIIVYELGTERVMGALSMPKDNDGSTDEQLSKKSLYENIFEDGDDEQ
jgi:hypothetical protein